MELKVWLPANLEGWELEDKGLESKQCDNSHLLAKVLDLGASEGRDLGHKV